MEIVLLADVVIIFSLSVAVMLLFHYLRLPSVVGLFLTGILAGPHGFGLVGAVHEVEVLAEVGIVLLLFTIGIEFSFKKLLEIKKQVLLGGGLQVGLTTVVVYFFAREFGIAGPEAVFYGFLVSLSSTAIVLRLLQARAEIDTPHGRAGLGILLFQDVIIVPMILVTPILAGNHPAALGSGIYLMAAKGAAIISLFFVAAKWVIPWILHRVARTRSKELFLLSVVTICFGIAWFTSSVGLSLALGAFIAGLIISESEYSHQALGNILPFRDVFTSFFFVSIGMLLDTGFLVNNAALILFGSVGILILKASIAIHAMMLLGLPLRSGILATLAICQVGEFSFILSKTGVNYGLLADHYQLFLAVTILTMAATPFILSQAPRLADRFLQIPFPQKLKTGLSPKVADDGHDRMSHHLVIIGFGLNGRNVARAARMSGIPYKVIEISPETVKEERKNGEPIFFGDAMHEEVLHHADIEEATVVVVAINDPTATRGIAVNVRKMATKAHVIVRTRYLKEMQALYDLGVDEVIPEEFETSVEIFSRVLAKYLIPADEIDKMVVQLRSDGYEMFRRPTRDVSLFSNLHLHLPDVEVISMRVEEGASILGKSLLELELRKKHGVTILAVCRGEETITNLDVEMHFSVGDVLYVMGEPDKLTKSRGFFSKAEEGDDTAFQ